MNELRPRKNKPIPPPLNICGLDGAVDATDRLTEFAIIATSPRSPLMQKNLPIRKRAYSYPSADEMHSYARPPHSPPLSMLSPPLSQPSQSSLSSSLEELDPKELRLVASSFPSSPNWCQPLPKAVGLPCRELEEQDSYLPQSTAENVQSAIFFESWSRLNFTPEDTTAAVALSTMAKHKQLSTMSPPSSPTKRSEKGECNRPKRPMNGFMLFAKKYRVEYTQLYPGKDNRAISVLLGDTWKKMSNEDRTFYASEARLLAEQQKKIHPDCWKRKRSLSTS